KISFGACKNSLTKDGVYLSAVTDVTLFIQMMWTSVTAGKKAKSSATGMLPVKTRLDYLTELKTLLATRKIQTIIDHHYPLCMAAEAHTYVETGIDPIFKTHILRSNKIRS
ncbi:MAG TPA: zinc-binding dehydrogenase, partial [Ferruginibacter sp.]|nr:zinc-binding dehydrogenase [Ferruginibacter sp.]